MQTWLENVSIYIFEYNLSLPMGQMQGGSIQLRDGFQARGPRGPKETLSPTSAGVGHPSNCVQSPITKLPCYQAQPQSCATAHLHVGPHADELLQGFAPPAPQVAGVI